MSTESAEALPLVTIVTPSFNQGRFIRETIESVLTQDYPNIEYIVVDAASTDETADVVRGYAGRLTFISEPDRGQSHAINKGFARARGSIVAWLNSDDVFLPGAVSAAVKAFQEHPQVGVVYGEGYQIAEDGTIISRFPYTQHFDRWKLVHASDYILQQTVFFRKAALDAVGPLREDLHFVMDWEILNRLALRYDFKQLPDFMGSLREYGAAKTFTGGAVRAREISAMLKPYTGTALSPGYLIYGFSTYERIAAAWLDAWPAWLQAPARFLRRISTKLCHSVVNYAMRRAQAWHRDGWMAPRAHVMLPQGAGEAVLRGRIPGNIAGLERQQVTVRYRGRVLARQEFAPGDFELRFFVGNEPNCAPVLRIEASQGFVFSKVKDSTDKRRLSLLLHSVEWAQPIGERNV
ncbi:MAG: glycosyltransferase family 2 protein [Candidatus Baltobacteraceae bacterium]